MMALKDLVDVVLVLAGFKMDGRLLIVHSPVCAHMCVHKCVFGGGEHVKDKGKLVSQLLQ